MNKLKAVFWDVDGTIADTELCGHREAFNMAFKDFNLDWNWDEKQYLYLLKISGGLNRIIHYRNEIKSELSDSQCYEIQLKKRLHYKNLLHSGKITVREGVPRLINELSSLNVKQFIVTTSGRDSLNPFLETSLKSHMDCFSRVVTYEDVSKHKPFPDAYLLALELSNESETNCIAIEDSMIGAKAAKRANLSCLLTLPPWSNTVCDVYRKADACVNSLGDFNNPSTQIYGKKLINGFVDYKFLNSIIN